MAENNQSTWKNLKQIYAIMFRYWYYVVGGIFTMILYAVMNGVSITMVVPVLDVVLKPRESVPLITSVKGLSNAVMERLNHFFSIEFRITDLQSIKQSGLLNDLKEILFSADPYIVLQSISVLVISLFIIKNLFYYLNRFMFTNLRGRTVRDIRILMFGKYLSQSLAFFNQNKVGDSQVRMDNDVTIVSNEFISNLFIVLRDLMVMFSCMIVAYLMNPRLFFISLLITPIFAVSVSYIGKKIKKYAKKIQMHYSDMFTHVEEALNSMRIVKAFSKEDFELNSYRTINNRYRRLWQKVEMYSGLNIPISEISSAIIGVVLLLIAGKEMLSSQSSFTMGEFTAFLIAIFATLHPLKTLTKAYAELKKALVSLERISYIINFKPEIVEAENPVSKTNFTDRLTVDKVGFHYSTTDLVLSDISFEIRKGERVAIIGGSGSGKTTLVNLFNRMYDYTEGEIKIDGIPIKNIRLKDLRGLFGVVPQDSQLFSNTISFNIQYGNQQPLEENQVIEAARIAYADEFIEKYPDKYNQLLQTKGSDLSGGQKQRLCIARAIAADPPILIFDEATSALDTDSEKKVQEAISRATENRTVIMIAHRLSTVLDAEKIIVLEAGKIVGIGSHEELSKCCPRYQQLYNLQFKPQENRG
jgi:ABC-type multidrug transport system fused ATPase/permease subunit